MYCRIPWDVHSEICKETAWHYLRDAKCYMQYSIHLFIPFLSGKWQAHTNKPQYDSAASIICVANDFPLFPTFVHMVIESLLRTPNVWEILLAKICLNIQLFCLWMQSWCKQQSTELCSTSFLPICWFSSEMGKCFRMFELQLSTTYFLPRIHRQYSRCDRCFHHAWHPFRSEASHSVWDVVAILRQKFTISHV